MSKQSVIAELKKEILNDQNLTEGQKREQLQQLDEAVREVEKGEITKKEMMMSSLVKQRPSKARTAICKRWRKTTLMDISEVDTAPKIEVMEDRRLFRPINKGGRADFFQKRYPKH